MTMVMEAEKDISNAFFHNFLMVPGYYSRHQPTYQNLRIHNTNIIAWTWT